MTVAEDDLEEGQEARPVHQPPGPLDQHADPGLEHILLGGDALDRDQELIEGVVEDRLYDGGLVPELVLDSTRPAPRLLELGGRFGPAEGFALGAIPRSTRPTGVSGVGGEATRNSR
jgi:hypothetical protein